MLSEAGPSTYRLERDADVTFADFSDQIQRNRIAVFNSPEALYTMETALNSTIDSKVYEKSSERGAAWNTEFMNRQAIARGLRNKCIKSLLYPTQICNDSLRRMQSIKMRLTSLQNIELRNDPQKQREMLALVESGLEYVSRRLQLLENFRDSGSFSISDMYQEEMMERLVYDYNKLSDLGHRLYGGSNSSKLPLVVPRVGRVDLTTAIIQADKEGYNDQWSGRGATATSDTLPNKQPKEDLYKLLTPNGIKNEPEQETRVFGRFL